ncbi:MAG TPA: thioredoxin domain-containing protein, partial [Actinomycetota bacterium]|nr:thioredoxin domain-containing protein [Actinomycetota bacterium]
MQNRPAPNRLIDETSPYLLQHAWNPVDWYPWGPEALERARSQDRPILLSIGYAACHWCHVMAHESFEDAETAALMNERFVCIKVDREERPDLDGIYMDAVQAMTGQGGWPMTVFLTPEGGPFYAGTYYPKVDRPGMPSFKKVLLAVDDAWQRRRDDARHQGAQVVELIAAQAGSLAEGAGQPEEATLRQAFDGLQRAFDPTWGGFGPAPKFPQPMTLEFLLRCHLRGFEGALDMVELTLNRMASGGIFDQLGGGFHRYSTDRRWLVPHFEKMLYDNAQLVRLYARAWQVTGADRHRQVAVATADYLLRELRHPQGGFFSSQDADSEGEEGKFFVWSYQELVEVAGEPVARFLGALPEGNWEGGNVLWTPLPAKAAAEAAGVGVEELERALPGARAALFERREGRVRPATDDKVLAAWNGLAIGALAEAGRVLPEPRYVAAAVAAAEFVLSTMRTPRLRRAWRDGRLGGPGYLDDYACMAEACLTLYETTFEPRWLREALALADELL